MSRVVVCALARHEEVYIVDWIKWWRGIGVDHFYLWDNNDLNDQKLYNTILPEQRQYVTVINIRGRHEGSMQHHVYTEFYKSYGQSFDWCFFVDIDEFLTNVADVHQWLDDPQFCGVQAIRIRWRLFGDDNLIERDMSKPVWEGITQVQDFDPELSCQGKTVLRGKMRNVTCRSCHWFKVNNQMALACLPTGEACTSKYKIEEPYTSQIKLNHYRTKTLSEFMKQKYGRGDAIYSKININLDYYFITNKKTPEKLAWLKENYGIEL